VEGNVFGVNIIPHTAERTTLHLFKPGRPVNVEVDVIARYLERLLQGGAGTPQGLTLEQLAKAGFVKA
jgi:riboflavin synthase